MKRLLAIALIMAACGGSMPSRGPSTATPSSPDATPTPEPTLASPPAVSAACNAAWAAAVAVDEMANTRSDFFPAVRACTSLDDWSAAFAACDGAWITAPPIEALRNICRALEVTKEPLCKSVPSEVDVPPDVAAIAEEACADTTYTGCIEGVRIMFAESSADLIVICEYGDGLGDVIIIASEDQAAEECAFGGHTTSRVVKVLRIPRDP